MPHAKEYKQRREAGLCGTCGVHKPQDGGTKCKSCTLIRETWQLNWIKEITAEVFTHYGNKCYCSRCPETNSVFLTIDHIDKEGRLRDKGKVGPHLYKWLKQLGYPKDVRLSCFNCNCGRQYRGVNGICPHMNDTG